MTFADFCTEVKTRAFPEGVAENLDDLYDKRIVNALAEAQRYCPLLRTCNYTSYTYDNTSFFFGTTLLPKPAGKVLEVFTYRLPDQTDRVYYTLSDPLTIRRLLDAEAYAAPFAGVRIEGTEVYATPNPTGVYPGNEAQGKGFRANSGLFCLEQMPSFDDEVFETTGHLITLHPNIESVETVVVRWLGKKTSYAEDDLVSFSVAGVDYINQVYDFVEAHLRFEAAAKDNSSTSDAQVFAADKARALRDLLLDIKDDTEAQEPLNR